MADIPFDPLEHWGSGRPVGQLSYWLVTVSVYDYDRPPYVVNSRRKMTQSPTVARWELARRISARRKELDLDVQFITDRLGFSRNYFSAVENDRTLIAEDKLQALVKILEFDADESADLLELRKAARQRGWWEDYPAFDEHTKRFLGLEYGASHIRTYDGLVLPGLLQTEDYARCIMRSDPAVSSTQLDEAVEVRRQRQRRLTGDEPVHLSALVSEAALRQYVGGPEVQVDQLAHLVKLVEANPASIELRVMPFTTDPGIIVTSSTMAIFEFSRPQLPAIAFQEAVRALDAIEFPEPAFRRLELAWADARKLSPDREASLKLVRRIAGEIGG